MDGLLKRKELAYEAVNLIREVIEEMKFLGENLIQDVKQNETGNDIILESNNCTVEYSLSEVSYIFTDNVTKLWENGESFFEALKNSERNKNITYKQVSKNAFIDKYGRIEYIKVKSKEVISRLKEIEQEV